MECSVSSRRSLLRSAAAVGAGSVPVLFSVSRVFGQSSPPNPSQVARNCYVQAAGADISVGFTGVGYKNAAVFNQLASELQYIQGCMTEAGLTDAQIAAAAAKIPPGGAFPDVNPVWCSAMCRAAGWTPTMPGDFFQIQDAAGALLDMQVTAPTGAPTSLSAVNSLIGQVVTILQQYATGNYAYSPTTRAPQLVRAGFLRLADWSTNTNTLAAAGAGIGAIGVGLLTAAGGTAALTSSVPLTALIAGSGLGLVVVGVAVLVYVAYRIYTQEHSKVTTQTVWSKPTDQPSNSWLTRWASGGGMGSAYDPAPYVFSSVCYPPAC